MPVEDQTILIIGAGGREHAISVAYEKSPNVKRIIIADIGSGNDFIAYKREKEVIVDTNCSIKDPDSFKAVAKKYKPDWIDVQQDDILASGVVDLLEDECSAVFGPSKSAARIESDKKSSREFMQEYGIPHPEFKYFDDETNAQKYVEELYSQNPERLLYVKATGLCAGKGALKSLSLEDAVKNIREMKTFPNGAGRVFLIEDGLVGEEYSQQVITDRKTYKILKSAQDNKTVFNFDQGDQTGGMGAISPAMVTQGLESEIEREQVSKAIKGMILEGNPFRGILYVGGIVVNSKVSTIEYNARWGDPECQVVLPSIETDYFEIVKACLEGRLKDLEISQDNMTRICVAGVSRGYPKDYSSVKGKRIYGIDEVLKMDGIRLFGAGIEIVNSKFYANGGRLFYIVGEGGDIIEAKQRAYSAMARISIEGNNLHYRTDIGWRDIDRFRKL